MKFLGGFITGVLATILVLVLIYVGMPDRHFELGDTLSGLTMLPEKGDCIGRGEIEIFQTIKPNVALAHIGGLLDGTLVLLIGNDDDLFWDNKIITIPSNKCARQVGVYRYEARYRVRTVPAVVIGYR